MKKEPIGFNVPTERAPHRRVHEAMMPTVDEMSNPSRAQEYIREHDRIEWTDGFDCAMQRKDLTIVATREFAAGWMAGRRMSNELHMRGYIATKRTDV